MMKFICCLLAALPLFAQSQTTPFTIKGKIGTIGAPAKVLLKYFDGEQGRTDSAFLKNGQFTIKGRVASPSTASLLLIRDGQALRWPYDELMFYIVEGTTMINGKDSAVNALATGNTINADYNQYKEMINPVYAKMNVLEEGHATMDPEQLNARRQEIIAEAGEVERQFVRSYPNSIVSLRVLNGLSQQASTAGGFDTLQQLFTDLTPALRDGKDGKDLQLKLQRQRTLLVGQLAPELVQPDSSGVNVSLSSLRNQYVLVLFWASWCKPCRAENPVVVQAYEKYRNKNFTIMGISVDTNRDRWLKAVKDDKIQWMQLSDLQQKNAAADLYEINGVPSSFLIDPSGKIIRKNIRAEEMMEVLGSVLGK